MSYVAARQLINQSEMENLINILKAKGALSVDSAVILDDLSSVLYEKQKDTLSYFIHKEGDRYWYSESDFERYKQEGYKELRGIVFTVIKIILGLGIILLVFISIFLISSGLIKFS